MRLICSLVSVLALARSGVCAGLIDCYGFGGSVYENNTRCPGSNACCGFDATCLDNRLCHKPNDGKDTMVRGPCSIEEYDSGTCAQICLYDEVDGILPRVRICSDGSLCCNDDSQCCDNGGGVFLDNEGKIADRAPSTTVSWGPERTASTFRTDVATSTTASATTTSATASASVTNDPGGAGNDDSDDDSQGLTIGLGVGIPVAAILLGAVGWFFWRRRRAARKTQVAELGGGTGGGTYSGVPKANEPMETGSSYNPHQNYSPGQQTWAELDGGHGPTELDAGHRPNEMQG